MRKRNYFLLMMISDTSIFFGKVQILNIICAISLGSNILPLDSFPVIFLSWVSLPCSLTLDVVCMPQGYTLITLDFVHFSSTCRFSTNHACPHLAALYAVICWYHFNPIVATTDKTSASFFLMRSNSHDVSAKGQTTLSLNVISASVKSISLMSSTCPSPAQCTRQSNSGQSACMVWMTD